MGKKGKKQENEEEKTSRVYNDFGLIRTIGDEEDFGGSSSEDEEKRIDMKSDPIVEKKGRITKELNQSASISFTDLETSADVITAKTPYLERWMQGSRPGTTIRTASLEEQIRKARIARAAARAGDFKEEDDLENSIFEQEILQADDGDVVRTKKKRKQKKRELKSREKVEEEAEDEDQKFGKFEVVDAKKIAEDDPKTFTRMNLSRTLLRALSDTGFSRPTPIQTACIPLALAGRDICACAATGTGKTFAFMLPILERLLLKPPKSERLTRVLVLAPTRELAVQVYDVTRQLARYMNDLEMVVSAGGFDLKAQEAALRRRPDIVIATPGRLIDHLQNAPNFSLENIEILVLDEADRMLDEFFADQMKEIIRLCSPIRQTMLFSATMTERVRDLATVSLQNPVKVFVNTNAETGDKLSQEFVRIRPKREADREAILASILSRTLKVENTVVFVQTKRLAHRLHVQLGLIGLQVAELHSGLTQAQRSESLRRFKSGQIRVLVATDLAARGLDIDGIDCVVNMTLPATLAHYIHRVGRTARAGKTGRSISFVGEDERPMMKEIRKAAKSSIHWRVIPTSVIDRFHFRLQDLEETIETILSEEKTERAIATASADADRAQARIESEKLAEETGGEAVIRRKRSWFLSGKEKEVQRESQKLALFEKRKKKGKKDAQQKDTSSMGPAERLEYELQKTQQLAKRIAKRNGDFSKIKVLKKGATLPEFGNKSKGDEGGKKQKSSFNVDFNEVNAVRRRHRKDDNNGSKPKPRKLSAKRPRVKK